MLQLAMAHVRDMHVVLTKNKQHVLWGAGAAARAKTVFARLELWCRTGCRGEMQS